jgi:hypothetical protein
LSPCAPAGNRALRSVITGWIAAAPSSTAWRTIASIVSLAVIACTSVTASAGSRSTASKRSMRAHASRFPARVIVAAYSPPVPSKSTIASPGESRRTRNA